MTQSEMRWGPEGPSGPFHMAVLIPARNEERLLPRCLQSVQEARAMLPRWVSSDVVVVSDSSSDRTREIAKEMLRDSGIVMCAQFGVVGAARALAARTALLRSAGLADSCWLANTDADCEVSSCWLLRQLREAARGTHAVAGIVDVDDFSEHLPHVRQRFRDTYVIERDGTHPHVHGANLGVRGDAYLKAGGWADLVTAEDHDLWSRLKRERYCCYQDATLRVLTSGRRVGRAPDGFAGALAAHNEMAA